MAVLFNPENAWERPERTLSVDRGEIARRIGEVDEPPEVLGGGQANINVRIGDRVLRVYRREPAAAAREAALLARPWRCFRVPELLAAGVDFALLRYVAHRPLEDRGEHGAAAGRALAEIHRIDMPGAGFLGPALELVEPMDDFIAALIAHAEAAAADTPWEPLGAAVAGALRRHEGALRQVIGAPVLLHGDFKLSNLHRAEDELLVLDWEFAYAGPRLMDVGQLVRWPLPASFVDAFAGAYREAGGVLPEDWPRWAAALDLANLMGLLAGADTESRRARDVRRRIQDTLDQV